MHHCSLMLGDIIYEKNCNLDNDIVDYAFAQLYWISNTRPNAIAFMRYMNNVWRAKIPIWCIGAQQTSHSKLK